MELVEDEHIEAGRDSAKSTSRTSSVNIGHNSNAVDSSDDSKNIASIIDTSDDHAPTDHETQLNLALDKEKDTLTNSKQTCKVNDDQRIAFDTCHVNNNDNCSNTKTKQSQPDETQNQNGATPLKLNAPSLTANGSLDAKSRLSQIRFLVRRREAGALIGKRGSNIKRLRDTFSSSIFSIPDTGNGLERVVCVSANDQAIRLILSDICNLLHEKSAQRDNQIELKLLIHSWHAGLLIGMGGQSIKKLRNDSKAAIKIFEMCCPYSNERVCAIKARPSIVVETVNLILQIVRDNPFKGTIKLYDALNCDVSQVDKYGGFLPEEPYNVSVGGNSNSIGVAAAINSPFSHQSRPADYQQHHHRGQHLFDHQRQQHHNHHAHVDPSSHLLPLHSLLDSFYRQAAVCSQQRQLQHQLLKLQQQQRINELIAQRPMKRCSIWRAPPENFQSGAAASEFSTKQQVRAGSGRGSCELEQAISSKQNISCLSSPSQSISQPNRQSHQEASRLSSVYRLHPYKSEALTAGSRKSAPAISTSPTTSSTHPNNGQHHPPLGHPATGGLASSRMPAVEGPTAEAHQHSRAASVLANFVPALGARSFNTCLPQHSLEQHQLLSALDFTQNSSGSQGSARACTGHLCGREYYSLGSAAAAASSSLLPCLCHLFGPLAGTNKSQDCQNNQQQHSSGQ